MESNAGFLSELKTLRASANRVAPDWTADPLPLCGSNRFSGADSLPGSAAASLLLERRPSDSNAAPELALGATRPASSTALRSRYAQRNSTFA